MGRGCKSGVHRSIPSRTVRDEGTCLDDDGGDGGADGENGALAGGQDGVEGRHAVHAQVRDGEGACVLEGFDESVSHSMSGDRPIDMISYVHTHTHARAPMSRDTHTPKPAKTPIKTRTRGVLVGGEALLLRLLHKLAPLGPEADNVHLVGVAQRRRDEPPVERDGHGHVDLRVVLDGAARVIGGVDDGVLFCV